MMILWAWLIVIAYIQCRVEAGTDGGCIDGVCSNHDNRMRSQRDQPISDRQVNYYKSQIRYDINVLSFISKCVNSDCDLIGFI